MSEVALQESMEQPVGNSSVGNADNGLDNSFHGVLVDRAAPARTATSGSWQPGQSGNPKGRPPGTRNKLSDKFLKTMLKVFKTHGLKAVQDVAKTDPATFVRSLVAILPKDYQVNVTNDDGTRWVISAAPTMSNDEWQQTAIEGQHSVIEDSTNTNAKGSKD